VAQLATAKAANGTENRNRKTEDDIIRANYRLQRTLSSYMNFGNRDYFFESCQKTTDTPIDTAISNPKPTSAAIASGSTVTLGISASLKP
tara:strand:- start:22002 stop:22271 length:270 start_codon:yes stop_codon:yes gene_type:complete